MGKSAESQSLGSMDDNVEQILAKIHLFQGISSVGLKRIAAIAAVAAVVNDAYPALRYSTKAQR